MDLDRLIWHLAAVKYYYIIFLRASGRTAFVIALSVPPAIWRLANSVFCYNLAFAGVVFDSPFLLPSAAGRRSLPESFHLINLS
jgi:hypothetical protein